MRLRRSDIVCLAVVIAVTVACAAWVVRLGVKKQQQLRVENEVLSKRLNDLNLSEAKLQQLEQALGATKKELQALNDRIPESSEMGKFLGQLDGFKRLRTISLIAIQPLPPVKEKLYVKLPIRLMTKGTFLNTYQLLLDLETMNRTLLVERLIINKSITDEECQADVTASLFQR